MSNQEFFALYVARSGRTAAARENDDISGSERGWDETAAVDSNFTVSLTLLLQPYICSYFPDACFTCRRSGASPVGQIVTSYF
jgi:hypothetical protein